MLNPNQERFCIAYVHLDSDATNAYLEAFPGCTYSTANSQGCRLLKNPDIQDRIKVLIAEHNKEFIRSKNQTIRDVMEDIKDCKSLKKYNELYKFRDMFIRLQGFYDPVKIDVANDVHIVFNIPGVTQDTPTIPIAPSPEAQQLLEPEPDEESENL